MWSLFLPKERSIRLLDLLQLLWSGVTCLMADLGGLSSDPVWPDVLARRGLLFILLLIEMLHFDRCSITSGDSVALVNTTMFGAFRHTGAVRQCCSPAVAELAVAAEPKYHAAPCQARILGMRCVRVRLGRLGN